MTALSKRNDSPETASRPFDLTRDGFVLGEGAGVVVVESLAHALGRGATPLVEVMNHGLKVLRKRKQVTRTVVAGEQES